MRKFHPSQQALLTMTNFIIADRKTDYLLPPSLDDWLNEDHLARFVGEVVDQLDLSKLTRQYAGRGSKAHHPAPLLAILVYGYATGVFSSRKLERATYDSVALRYIAAGSHPDHDTLATLRRRFLGELELAILEAQSGALGEVTCLIADTGFCSENNLLACEKVRLDALIAVARDEHHPGWRERHSEPMPLLGNASPTQAMAHRLKTKARRALYALRKQTVEPVFGIIKSVLGFRQFSLRGLKKVSGEWRLVCLAWNVKRMAKLRPKYG